VEPHSTRTSQDTARRWWQRFVFPPALSSAIRLGGVGWIPFNQGDPRRGRGRERKLSAEHPGGRRSWHHRAVARRFRGDSRDRSCAPRVPARHRLPCAASLRSGCGSGGDRVLPFVRRSAAAAGRSPPRFARTGRVGWIRAGNSRDSGPADQRAWRVNAGRTFGGAVRAAPGIRAFRRHSLISSRRGVGWRRSGIHWSPPKARRNTVRVFGGRGERTVGARRFRGAGGYSRAAAIHRGHRRMDDRICGNARFERPRRVSRCRSCVTKSRPSRNGPRAPGLRRAMAALASVCGAASLAGSE